jgi:nucleoside triphosphate diphosphatase
MDTNKDRYDINDLKELMARLRSPVNGCPWDIEQDFNSIKPHTIEEAYEVADAIERSNMNDLKDELGDLLFQVIFHAQMAKEQDKFSIDDVIDHVTKKMIFRHPHVFDNCVAETADDVRDNIWEQQKIKEKQNQKNENGYYLDNVTRAFPALLLANKIQKKVRNKGFKYSDLNAVLDKLSEEINELKQAVNDNNQNDIDEELGDILFVSALLAEHTQSNPEECLRQACLKFIRRFNAVEDDLKGFGKTLDTADIHDMEQSWTRIKNDIAVYK